ncbi:MAG: hypothetical protein WCK47_09335 [bacterium]|nr:hypothetical protein [Candidatus Sumerlaeota bacterium]
MNGRDILLNIFLLTLIGSLTFLIFDKGGNDSGTEIPEMLSASKPSKEETSFNPLLATAKYPKFGEKPLYKAIITPTPSPTPPPPTPAPTPNIGNILKRWRLLSAYAGSASIEDTGEKDPEKQFFDMKVGEIRTTRGEKTEMRNVRLNRIDEQADEPSATFSMDGTTAVFTIRTGDNPQPAGPQPGAMPGMPPRPPGGK